MDFKQIQAMVSISNQRLDCPFAGLVSAPISQELQPYFPDGMIHVREITDNLQTDTSITIHGTGDAFPFLNMPVMLVFGLAAVQSPIITMTATGPAGWTLGQTFPILQNSVFSLAQFAASPTFSLSFVSVTDQSSATPPQQSTDSMQTSSPPLPAQNADDANETTTEDVTTTPAVGIMLDGTLSAQSPLAAFSFLLGEGTAVVSGFIGLIEDVPAPSVALLGAVDHSIKLDFLDIRNVHYGLFCDPFYNSAYMSWQEDAYLSFGADLIFHTQNQDITIPVYASTYDTSSNILFVADITDAIDAALEELSMLVNGLSLQLPQNWLSIVNHVSLTELQVSVNPGGAQKINYLTLKLETIELWTLIPDLLELQAIDVNFRVDTPFSQPELSGSISGLIGIGETGTLELSASFEEFSFGGELRDGDSLKLSELFEHFLQENDENLPDIDVASFVFYVQPDSETYAGTIELDGDWALAISATQSLILEEMHLELNHPGKGLPITFDAQGWFSIAGTLFSIESRYDGPVGGWTFSGETGPGQAIPIGTLIADITTYFDAVTLPSVLADLAIDNLAVSFNTHTKHVSFTCSTTTTIDSLPIGLSVVIDVLPSSSGYTKTFGGTITIGTRQFALLFSEDATASFLIATYSNAGGDKISIKEDIVAPLSTVAAQDIPAGLMIDFKDVLVLLSRGMADKPSTIVCGLDLAINAPSLSNLPLVGRMLPANETISVNNLRVLVASQALTSDTLSMLNSQLGSNFVPLPTTDLKQGLTLAAALDFGGTPRLLTVPVAGASPTTTATTPGASPTPTSAGTASTTTTDNAIWYPVQKAYGPVYFNRVGVQYQDAAAWFLLDAALTLAGLTLWLDGLSFGSPLSKFELEFQLRGLGLDYQSGPVEIGGAFLHEQDKQPDGSTIDEYSGLATIKTEELTLTALGAYADLAGNPSLFIYAVLDYPLGGPSFFFVTGLAAGFGYNRALIVPPVDQVAQFPLVADAVSGAIPAQNAHDLGIELAKFDRYLYPELGEIFFAIGIKYTSFKLIDSFALLTVAFGNEFELDVLGLSTMVLPTPVPDVPNPTPLSVVQMAVKVSFIPALGFLGVSAQLTAASYLLSGNCHLTGGFAFYSWFSGEHAGDFVQTLGGYHPSFVVPLHYPTVPRLGFQWQVDDSVSIKGKAYGALTASALMAGIHVQANWQSGSLRAWFNAAFDFLLSWKPFYYDISLSVDMGASYTFNFFGTHTVSVDVGADLHIWGPEFSGSAHIKLSIISFDVSFGANASHTPTPIDWPTFKKSFLPDDASALVVLVKGGLVSKQGQDTLDLGVLDPKQFSLVTNSLVPAASAHMQQDFAPTQPIGQVAIGSMGVQASEFASMHTIAITREGVHVEQDFTYTPVLKNVPAALWGHNLTPDLNGPRFVENALTGFEITPAASLGTGATTEIETSKLRYEASTIASAYTWTADTGPFQAEPLNDAESRQRVSTTFVSPAVNTARQQFLALLGIDVNQVDLSATSGSALANGFVLAPQIERVEV